MASSFFSARKIQSLNMNFRNVEAPNPCSERVGVGISGGVELTRA